jgi:hypothetical protein
MGTSLRSRSTISWPMLMEIMAGLLPVCCWRFMMTGMIRAIPSVPPAIIGMTLEVDLSEPMNGPLPGSESSAKKDPYVAKSTVLATRIRTRSRSGAEHGHAPWSCAIGETPS